MKTSKLSTDILILFLFVALSSIGGKSLGISEGDVGKVALPEGVILPVVWGDLGSRLVNNGVIDAKKFRAIYEERGEFSNEYRDLLFGRTTGRIKITRANSGYLLNLFWALGLANKNRILEEGEITSPNNGGAGNFASTGGWTISRGDPMSHYSRHVLFTLTPDEEALVDRMSRGIYRPCCNNSTHFPDCNHGMAMLGLLELMAVQGVSEEDMWKAALVVNSFWFPDEYRTIRKYKSNLSPQEILGVKYSSASGYAEVSAKVNQGDVQGGGGCSI